MIVVVRWFAGGIEQRRILRHVVLVRAHTGRVWFDYHIESTPRTLALMPDTPVAYECFDDTEEDQLMKTTPWEGTSADLNASTHSSTPAEAVPVSPRPADTCTPTAGGVVHDEHRWEDEGGACWPSETD